MVKRHAVEREVPSGKVTEVYLTPRHMKNLRSGKPAWLRVKGEWLVINPMTKTREQIEIEKLEAKLMVLKKKQNSKAESMRKHWQSKSPEEQKAHMEKMRLARKNKKQEQTIF